MLFDGTQINLLIAFIGGVITFFASCLLPLVPTYLAYLSGLSIKSSSEDSKGTNKRRVFLGGLFFTLGFVTVFVLLGATANSLGRLLSTYRLPIQRVGGIFFLIMGAFILELFKPQALYKELKIKLPTNLIKWQKLNAFIVGVTFGFAWTPCIGPVLAVILFWASQAETLLKGVSLLFVYGVGLAIPFLVIALAFEKLAPLLAKTARFGKVLQIISGIVIIVMGMLLIMGRVDIVSIQLLRLFGLNEHAI